MNRRDAIKLFGKSALCAATFSSRFVSGLMSYENKRNSQKLVLIYDSTGSSSLYESLLKKAGPFLTARDKNWRLKLISLDIHTQKKAAEAFINKHGSGTRDLSYPILVSVPENYEAEREVELWTVDWLEYSDFLDLDGCYPISGGWWSVDGDWKPSEKKVRDHLFKSSNHSKGKFQLPWLETLKLAELQSLHSDHHREMTKKGKVYWQNVNVECPNPGLKNISAQ